MAEKTADTTVANQVELVVRRLNSLSTLPSVAAQLFPKLTQPNFLPSDLTDIIESDPALTARIFSLMYQQDAGYAAANPSVSKALEKLPAHLVRDAALSVKVFQTPEPDSYRALPRKQLALYTLAVACCAKNIAEITSPQIDSQLAYSAGLLHNIGKLAIDQTMPKSFARIIEEAKVQKASDRLIEQKHLGLDYTILGKRLAQKWHLPNPIVLAIWLHRNDTVIISENMPETRIAQIVQLAYLIARQCGIGQSGSYDTPGSAAKIAQSLSVNSEQIQQIRKNLAEQVAQKAKIIGLDSPNIEITYSEIVHTATAQLAQDNAKLSQENRKLQTTSSHFDFFTDFLSSINLVTEPIEIAENFATRWQKFYQTGRVCLYLTPPGNPRMLEAVVVEAPSQSRTVIVNAPADSLSIPQEALNGFAVLDAGGYVDWLFEQLDVEFELSKTKLVPLLSKGKVAGAIVFEFRYPAQIELLEENFRAATSFAGSVLDMAFVSQDQQHFAEQFAQLLAESGTAQAEPQTIRQEAVETAPKESMTALAEMAAGAAHELNNPLSVISGRAQLLYKNEADAEKKQALKQIRDNAKEISQIIEDLMGFAQPEQPRPAQTDIQQILDEAIQLTIQKTGVEHLNTQIDVAERLKKVFVDSGQVVSAMANILSNSVESYSGTLGPIKVMASADEGGDFVKVGIADLGCGMDEDTVKKAMQPFFSVKPAGRKRGMGLAHAQRLIQLNGGNLRIESQVGKGTTVTVLLPSR